MNPRPRVYNELQAAAMSYIKRASTTAQVPEVDPAEKGTVSAPSHPDGDNPRKLLIPDGSRPTNTQEVDDGFSTQNPGPTGTDRVTTADGNAQDARFTSPTDPLSKCSSTKLQALTGDAMAVLERMVNFSKSANSNTAAPQQGSAPQQATQEPAVLGDDLIKLASTLLETEEGIQMVQQHLAARVGVNDARQIIKAASEDQLAFQRQVYAQQEMQEKEASAFREELSLVADLFKTASPVEEKLAVKLARVHIKNLEAMPPELHAFYKAGAADAAAVAGMEQETGQPELPGGGEDLAPEQILQLLGELVQSGQLDEQTATSIAEAIVGGAGGEAPPEGGMPPEAAMAEGAADPAEEAEVAEKSASTLRIANELIFD